jgi:UDP-glucose 4-epimerase
MRSVMVTHADEPIGRRIVKRLFHDAGVTQVLGVGSGPAPRAFDRFLADPDGRFSYVRSVLSRHRPVSDLFRSTRVREACVDTVVHVPGHQPGAAGAARLLAGVAPRTAEARLILQHCLETPGIGALVALGSAFVYRLSPGNANRLRESSELDLSPDVPAELRSWIDCDMVFHAEVGNKRLRLVLLRLPTVVASGGYIYLNPTLEGRAGPRTRPLGFDPLCALVADQDVAHAVTAAVFASRSGVYNVAGAESVPLSVLGRWTGRRLVPIPGTWLRLVAGALRLAGGETRLETLTGAHLRYGFTLDTRRAERDLGFRPAHRIGIARAGDGELRLETAPV